MKKNYKFLLAETRMSFVSSYIKMLLDEHIEPGHYLHLALEALEDTEPLTDMKAERFLEVLVNTKKPQIFAESEIRGGMHDWNNIELAILGDLCFATDVTIFDNGRWQNPGLHNPVLQGTLLYVPGALLRGKIRTSDLAFCTKAGALLPNRLYSLLRRRLNTVLQYASNKAVAEGQLAIVTIPGIGCGQFAGQFAGQIVPVIIKAIRSLIVDNEYPGIKTLWLGPHSEGEFSQDEMRGTRFIVSPVKHPTSRPQLSNPANFMAPECELYSIVAWDHVSWPGNDFFTMGRHTDDGVKTAATSAMFNITGTEGAYNLSNNKYEPTMEDTWEEVVENGAVQLHVKANLIII